MPIWKLEPTDTESIDWDASIYKGTAVVRAPDEKTARQLCTSAFLIATELKLGQSVPLPPWKTVTTCKVITDPKFKEEGSSEVLFPQNVE